MTADIRVRVAGPDDEVVVTAILQEAARWLQGRGMGMWRLEEIALADVARGVAAREFFIAESSGEPSGVLKYQLTDTLFWPDVPQDEAAYLHRFAVRRRFAGGVVSSALLAWAVRRTQSLGRQYLRLDCEAARPRLRAFYERFGFVHDSDRQVGPYFVSRYQLDVGTVVPALE